jgi:hypothetical protein
MNDPKPSLPKKGRGAVAPTPVPRTPALVKRGAAAVVAVGLVGCGPNPQPPEVAPQPPQQVEAVPPQAPPPQQEEGLVPPQEPPQVSPPPQIPPQAPQPPPQPPPQVAPKR